MLKSQMMTKPFVFLLNKCNLYPFTATLGSTALFKFFVVKEKQLNNSLNYFNLK